jgi:amidase
MKATKIPEKSCSREDYVARALEMVNNTAPFDVTGHPAITVPVGKSKGLPVGMMLIGKSFDESTILKAAYAYEQATAI